MTDVKISQLPAASLPLTGSEIFPLNQSGATVQTAIGNIAARTNTIATLRGLNPSNYSQVYVDGYYNAGDGVGGVFYASTGYSPGHYVDNGGTIIVPTGGDGSKAWVRTIIGPIDVKYFGAKGDGSNDDTTYIQNTIDFAAGKTIYLSSGQYKVTSELVIESAYTHLLGDGEGSTTIVFAPSGDATCLRVQNSSPTIITGGSVTNLRFYGADDGYAKTAIHLVDIDNYTIQNIAIEGAATVSGTSFWSGGTTAGGKPASIGLKIQGRDLSRVSDIVIAADTAVNIGINPNPAGTPRIDMDHFNFNNCYFLSNDNPNINVESGVNMTSTVFGGYQAWVLGTYGFYWNDTSSTANSYNLFFDNVRGEQGSSSSAYLFYLKSNSNIQDVAINNAYFSADRNGVYLRSVANIQLNNIFFNGAGKEALNADSTVDGIVLNNCLWNATATKTLTDQVAVWSAPLRASGDPLPPWAYYANSALVPKPSFFVGGGVSEESFTLANSSLKLYAQETAGTWSITTAQGYVCLVIMSGTQHGVTILSDPSAKFSGTPSAAGKVSIYWSAGSGAYVFENQTGGSLTFRIALLGAYQAF